MKMVKKKIRLLILDERSAFFVSSIFTGLIGLAFIPLLVRVFSIEEFAKFGSILLYTQILVPPLMFGFTNYLTSIYSEKDRSHTHFNDALSDWAKLFFIGIGLSAAVLLFLEDLLVTLVIVLFIAGKTMNAVGVQTCRLEKWRMRFALQQSGVQFLFYLNVIIGSFVFFGDAIFSFALGSLAFAIGAFLAIRVLKDNSLAEPETGSTVVKKNFYWFGLGAMMHSFGGVFLTQWDKFFTMSTFDDLEYAKYIIAGQYANGLVFLYIAFSQTIMPSIYTRIRAFTEGTSLSVWRFLFNPATVSLFVFFLLYQGFIFYIFPYFLTPDLVGAVEIAQLLGVGVFFQGNYFLISAIIFYFRKTFFLSLITWLCVATSVLTTIVLLPESVLTMALIYVVTWSLFFFFSLVFSLALLKRNLHK